MARRILLSLIPVLFAAQGWAVQQALFESFDTASEWVVGGNDSGVGSATATNDTTIKVEGTGSLKFVYNYSGRQWYEMGVTKTLATPIDLSEAVSISFQMYGDVAAADDLIWYIVLHTSSGKSIRYVDWTGLPPASWTNSELSFRTDMEVNPWVSLHDNPVLTEVDQISIIFQQVAGITAAGTATVYLDDMRLSTTGPSVQIYTIDDFESYADTAALQSTWLTYGNPAGGSLAASLSADAFQGSGALQVDYTMLAANYAMDCYRTLPNILNLESIDFLRLWVKGDPAIPSGQSPLALLSFEDAAQNQVRAWMTSALKTDDYDCYIFYTRIGGEGSTTTSPAYVFEQEVWDAGGTCDVTSIRKIHIKFMEPATPPASYNATLKFDRLEYAATPSPLSATGAWQCYE